jgi:quercetin dioxygenase-like cupin family protein
MDAEAFEQQMTADGFTEIETKDLPHRPQNEPHVHDSTVRGLVIEGAFIVRRDGIEMAYGAGEHFEVAKGIRHTEEIGPQGARVLIGRKY